MVSLYSFLIQVQCAGLRVEQRRALRLGRHWVPGAVRGGGRVLRGPPAAFYDHRILRQEAAPPQEREQAPSQTQVCVYDQEVRKYFWKESCDSQFGRCKARWQPYYKHMAVKAEHMWKEVYSQPAKLFGFHRSDMCFVRAGVCNREKMQTLKIWMQKTTILLQIFTTQISLSLPSCSKYRPQSSEPQTDGLSVSTTADGSQPNVRKLCDTPPPAPQAHSHNLAYYDNIICQVCPALLMFGLVSFFPLFLSLSFIFLYVFSLPSSLCSLLCCLPASFTWWFSLLYVSAALFLLLNCYLKFAGTPKRTIMLSCYIKT